MHQHTNSTIQSMNSVIWPNLYFASVETAISEPDTAVRFGNPVRILWRSISIYHLTLTYDPLTLNICGVWLSRDQTLYKILTQSNNPRRSYSDLRSKILGHPSSCIRSKVNFNNSADFRCPTVYRIVIFPHNLAKRG